MAVMAAVAGGAATVVCFSAEMEEALVQRFPKCAFTSTQQKRDKEAHKHTREEGKDAWTRDMRPSTARPAASTTRVVVIPQAIELPPLQDPPLIDDRARAPFLGRPVEGAPSRHGSYAGALNSPGEKDLFELLQIPQERHFVFLLPAAIRAVKGTN